MGFMERFSFRASQGEAHETASEKPVITNADDLARACERDEDLNSIIKRLQNMSIGGHAPGDEQIRARLYTRLYELVELDHDVQLGELLKRL